MEHYIKIQQYECIDHPVAIINVVSTENDDPVSAIGKLFDMKNLPEEFHKNYVDPDIIQFYILVHDNQNTTIDKKKYVKIF